MGNEPLLFQEKGFGDEENKSREGVLLSTKLVAK
jgi:hypothetical protein